MIQVLGQLSHLAGILGSGQQHHRIQLFSLLCVQRFDGPTHRVEILQSVTGEADYGGHLWGKAIHGDFHPIALRAASGPLQRPLNLLIRAGQVEAPGGFATRPRLEFDHQLGHLVEMGGEVPPIVDLLQLHAVGVHHAVRGDRPNAALDQVEGHRMIIQAFKHLR